MHLQESGEMYLETIYLLSKNSDSVRSIDVCEKMGFSKPSVSRAVGLLKQGGYLYTDKNGYLFLTDEGKKVAHKTYERHVVLSQFFESIGVSAETATNDACKIEHIKSLTLLDVQAKSLFRLKRVLFRRKAPLCFYTSLRICVLRPRRERRV